MEAYFAAGVPASKVVIGMPFYGRVYAGVPNADDRLFQPAEPAAAGEWRATIDYKALVERHAESSGFRRFWHDVAKVPWLYDADSRIWITYDDSASVAVQADYAIERGLGGVMFWEIGSDDGSLLRAIHSRFQNAGRLPAR